ncbi:MAG: serine--tRNA ligase [Thermoplasmata archaeon]|nr:serine--tRNA ligase [Thermoplasmata archaeon]MCI4332748.1 serine--tRNA ligase [Thermoplasmata archaeon]
MSALSTIRSRPEDLKQAILLRNKPYPDVDGLVALDTECRRLAGAVNALRAKRNDEGQRLAEAKKAGAAVDPAIVRDLGELRDRITTEDAKLQEAEGKRDALLLLVPQIPHGTVPVGKDGTENVVVREVPSTVATVAAPKPHFEIGPALNILDTERGAKVAGEGFYFLVGDGARLEMALINFMRETHRKAGYTEVLPPILISSASMTGTGQLPKFAEDSYKTVLDDLWLAPTAEVPLTNLYRDEVLLGTDLPLKVMAFTPCFRREAGGHGVETRGIARVHQFNKVELVNFVHPSRSYEQLETLLSEAEAIVKALGLRYRIVNLCTGDLPDKAAKCYDIELWAPGAQRWLEVSSVSNFEDFQSSRSGIRYREQQSAKPEFVHTLNGSGTALPRLLVAVLETWQTSEGVVEVPPVLRPFLGGQDHLERTPFVGERELGRGRRGWTTN